MYPIKQGNRSDSLVVLWVMLAVMSGDAHPVTSVLGALLNKIIGQTVGLHDG